MPYLQSYADDDGWDDDVDESAPKSAEPSEPPLSELSDRDLAQHVVTVERGTMPPEAADCPALMAVRNHTHTRSSSTDTARMQHASNR